MAKAQAFIDYAIRSCLDKCAQTDLPLTCLADCVSQLKDAGWDDSAIAAVQQAVLLAMAKSSDQSQAR